MEKKKLLTLMGSLCLILVLAALPFMAACPAPTPPAEEEEAPPPAEEEEAPPTGPTGELRIGVSTLHSETFHPFWQSSSRKFYYEPLYDFLVDIDENGNPREGIAYKWEESADHLSWTFWIRDGVKFHDGTPLTLDDVKYSLDEILNERNQTARAYLLPIQDWVEIVPPDKVVMHLKTPCILLPGLLSPGGHGGGVILPKNYIEQVGDECDTAPIGSGPYKFLEHKENSYIKYEALDSHWRTGTPKYKYLTFKLIPEEGTRIAALRAGEVDVITVSRSGAKELEDLGFPIVRKAGALDMALMFYYTYKPDNPLYKKEVREALVLAIDREAILEHIFLGQGKLIGHTCFMFTGMLGYKEYPIVPYDPERAKELLAQAGMEGFTMTVATAPRVEVPEDAIMAEAVAGYWRAIGLDAKVLPVDRASISALAGKKKDPPPGGFCTQYPGSARCVTSWRSFYDSDVEKYPYSHVQDPVLDELMGEFEAQVTIDGYVALTHKLTDRIVEMYYRPGLFNIDVPFAIGKDVPQWNPGRGNIESFRFEYIGTSKQ